VWLRWPPSPLRRASHGSLRGDIQSDIQRAGVASLRGAVGRRPGGDSGATLAAAPTGGSGNSGVVAIGPTSVGHPTLGPFSAAGGLMVGVQRLQMLRPVNRAELR
jgi:hypothetical protein